MRNTGTSFPYEAGNLTLALRRRPLFWSGKWNSIWLRIRLLLNDWKTFAVDRVWPDTKISGFFLTYQKLLYGIFGEKYTGTGTSYNSPSIHPSPVELTYSTVYRPSQEPEPTKKGSNSWLRKATELKYWYIKMLVDLVTLVAHQDLLNVVIGGVGLQLVQPVLNFLKRRNRSILRFAYRYWDAL